MKKLLLPLMFGAMIALAWKELPAIRRFVRIESM